MAGDAGDRAAGEDLSDSPSRFRSGADAPPVHWRATLLNKKKMLDEAGDILLSSVTLGLPLPRFCLFTVLDALSPFFSRMHPSFELLSPFKRPYFPSPLRVFNSFSLSPIS